MIMDVRSLRRDPERVHSHLTDLEDNSVVTNAPCKIQIPERFTGRHLAVIGSEVFTIGIFPIIFNDEYYAVNNTIAMMRINPISTERVHINGEVYLEFHFDKGSKIFQNTYLVVNDTLTYYVYDELINKGNFPWYINYYDKAKLFETANLHAGVNLGGWPTLQLIISTTQRASDDMSQLYRHVLTRHSDIVDNPPVDVPFRSVIWNTSDTTSKLNGAYFDQAITSALVNPSESVELIEELLRT